MQIRSFCCAFSGSLIVCVVPIVLTTTIILLQMSKIHLYFPKLTNMVQIICTSPYDYRSYSFGQHSGSVCALGHTFLSNRMVMLLKGISYHAVHLPGNQKRNADLSTTIHQVEAAEMLGCSRICAFFKVVVPNLISVVALLASGGGNHL